jgi:hypothetical protein
MALVRTSSPGRPIKLRFVMKDADLYSIRNGRGFPARARFFYCQDACCAWPEDASHVSSVNGLKSVPRS